MRVGGVLVVLAIAMVVWVRPAAAAGTFIAASSRVDVVHDAARDLLYISSGGEVLRHRLATGTFEAPFALGGNLKGMDLSPDGDTLAVADQTRSASEVWIWLVDLPTGTAQKVNFPRAFNEGGTWSVAYGNDGALLVSATFEGSGWVPLRRYDPSTGTTTVLAVPPFNQVRQNSMLAASGDAAIVAWEESNISSGSYGRYQVADGNIATKSSGTGWFNYEIGANADGTQFALPTYGGCFIVGANLAQIRTLGTAAGPQPIGVAYHPVEPIVYFPWSTTSEIRIFDTATFAQIGSLDAGYVFTHPGNAAFQWGRLKIARDGSRLFATVGGGVRFFDLYAPLAASSAALATAEDTALPITLDASVGNGGVLAYELTEEPAHGFLTGVPPDVTYVPDAEFAGADSFSFAASYGRARASATVSIEVTPVNDPPIAAAQAVATDEDAALAITLAGSDVEGTVLTYAIVAAPAHGTLAGTAPDLTYTPNSDYFGDDSFSFTVSDGEATSAPATVAIAVAAVNDAPVAVADAATTRKNTAVVIPVLANDSDVDGDALAISAVAPSAQGGTVAIVDTSVRYTPRHNFTGADSFTYTVSDGQGGQAVATVNVTVTKR